MPVFKIIDLKNAKIGVWKLSEPVEELYAIIFDFLSDCEKYEFQKFKSQQRRKEWLATRILLQKIKQSPFFCEIKYSETCKPFIDNEKIGISHSRDFVAIIISQTNEVAIDVEKISSKAYNIIHKFLSIDEQKLIDKNNETLVTLFWSAKETVYKFYGKKELPFIDQINILSVDFDELKIKCILSHKQLIEINFEIFEDNVLTYIKDF